jgi:hypothetical protein
VAAATDGPVTVADLIAAAASLPCAEPELLARLVLAEALRAVAEAQATGISRVPVVAADLVLVAPRPALLMRDSPRAPHLRVSGAEESLVSPTRLSPALTGDDRDHTRSIADIVVGLLGALRWAPSLELEETLRWLRGRERPSALSALARARELALAGLAGWAAGREEPGVREAGVREAGKTFGPPASPVPAGGEGQLLRSRRSRAAGSARSRAPARWLGVSALGTGRWTPLGGPLQGGARGGRALWVALAPAAAAGLLSALLAAVLLLGAGAR